MQEPVSKVKRNAEILQPVQASEFIPSCVLPPCTHNACHCQHMMHGARP